MSKLLEVVHCATRSVWEFALIHRINMSITESVRKLLTGDIPFPEISHLIMT